MSVIILSVCFTVISAALSDEAAISSRVEVISSTLAAWDCALSENDAALDESAPVVALSMVATSVHVFTIPLISSRYICSSAFFFSVSFSVARTILKIRMHNTEI